MNRIKDAIAFVTNDTAKADHILASYFGARVLVKAGMSKDMLKAVRDQTLAGV